MRWLVTLLGVAAGAVFSGWLMVGDTLSGFRGRISVPVRDPSVVVINAELGRGIPESPAALLGLAAPEGRSFSDAGLRHARFSVARLDSAEGGASALAVKLSALSPDNSLLAGRLTMDSSWSVVWPGHGSLFLSGRDDYRPLAADVAWNALRGQGLNLSVQPHELSMDARLLGAGGRLQDVEGNYREYLSPVAAGELELGLKED